MTVSAPLPHIQWHEGMLLSPQHFQQESARVDTLVGWQSLSANALAWGVKHFDIDAACAGNSVVMLDAYVKYRTHAKQDSADTSSGPFLSEVLALQAYYGKILGDRLTQSAGRAFLRRNYQNLINEFARLNPNNTVSLSKGDFLRRAINVGAASSRSIRCGTIYTGLSSIPRLIERRFKQILGRSRS